ncbi:MAG: putative methylase protein [uncultured bacterium]|nr:MAG: putative methylase protein [uncultured bacterium]
MDKKSHWEDVYQNKKIDEVSWYQVRPEFSLRMIEAAKLSLQDPIIDVGGGASRLVDHLIELGFKNISVLDISEKALEHARQRLGDAGKNIEWIKADIVGFKPEKKYAFWHDRAVFHFLTDLKDREQYLETMQGALSSPGYVMIAAFAQDGPEKCSGLPVQRYSHETLIQTLGPDYHLILKDREIHETPAKKQQSFIYGLFRH